MTEPTQDPADRILEEIGKQGKATLHYSRTRLLATWLAIGLLAMLTGIALWLAIENASTNLEQTDDIAKVANKTADSAKKQSDQTVAYMKGEQGIPGVPGSNGVDGTPGLPGGGGAPGEQGAQGPKGETGPQGPQGQQGLAGIPGTGGEGTPGPVGPTGPAGAKGATGDKGAIGEKGDTGAK